MSENCKVNELKIETLENRADKVDIRLEKLTENLNALAIKIATITGAINIIVSVILKYT